MDEVHKPDDTIKQYTEMDVEKAYAKGFYEGTLVGVQKVGELGGQQTKAKHGTGHFKRISRLGVEARKRKRLTAKQP